MDSEWPFCLDEEAACTEAREAAIESDERALARVCGTVPAAVLLWAVEEADDDWVPGRAWGDQAVPA